MKSHNDRGDICTEIRGLVQGKKKDAEVYIGKYGLSGEKDAI